jgi:hypothetical protein
LEHRRIVLSHRHHVGVDQPAQQLPRVIGDEVSLPLLEDGRSFMFSARPVLRKQTRPVIPVRLHVFKTFGVRCRDSPRWPSTDALHRLHDLCTNGRVVGTHGNAKHRDSRAGDEMAVAEILAEQICISSRVAPRECRAPTNEACEWRIQIDVDQPGTPSEQRRGRYAQSTGDLGYRHAGGHQRSPGGSC